MATLGTLLTFTTYGTWLRGDQRGWVDEGQVLPPQPLLELADYDRLSHPPFLFESNQLQEVGRLMGESLLTRLSLRLLALTVQRWHVHLVIPGTLIKIPDIIKWAKDAIRHGIKAKRPIWTEGYDKRFCFDWERLRERVQYVERHNEREGWPKQPWSFLLPWDEYVSSQHC